MAGRGKQKGSRRSANEWRLLLARLDGSGLSVEAFCQSEAISEASFYRWRRLLSEDGDEGRGGRVVAAPAFVDLGTLNSASPLRPRLDLKLDLGDGLVLHLVRG